MSAIDSVPVFERTKDRPLHEQVREHLRQHCSQAQSDAALPSLRQMSESLGVNHLTISRALRDLEGEGLVRVVPGRGAFVVKPETSQRVVEMLSFHTPFSDLLDTSRQTLWGMQSGLPEGFSLAGNSLISPPVPRVEEFLQAMRARQTAAMAIFGFGYLPYPDSFSEAELIHQIAAQIPVVLVGKEHRLLQLDCVYCDPAPQMLTFLSESYESGKRRFAYLGAQDNKPHLKHRLVAFQEFLLARGLPWQRPLPETDKSAEIAQLLAENPEVIVASDQYRAHALVVEAQQCGLRLGTDLLILCFAGSAEEVRAIAPYVSVVLLEEKEVGRCVMRRLESRLSGVDKPAPLTRRVPGRLMRQGALKFE